MPWPRSRPQAGPAFVLPFHDPGHTGRHVADTGQHVVFAELLAVHGVFTRQHFRVGNACVCGGFERAHVDAGAIGDDVDVDIGDVVLQAFGVVQRRVPFGRGIVAHLSADPLAFRA